MTSGRQPRYSKEEFARRGFEIYDLDIRSQVEAEHQGKFVAIDIENVNGKWTRTTTRRLSVCYSKYQTRKSG